MLTAEVGTSLESQVSQKIVMSGETCVRRRVTSSTLLRRHRTLDRKKEGSRGTLDGGRQRGMRSTVTRHRWR